MPQRCAAVGCTNSSRKSEKKRFFRFPAGSLHAAKRAKWVLAMCRVNEDGSPWEPTANSRVCSDHFLTGKPSRFIDHPDYVPSVFKHKKSKSVGALARFERLKNRQGVAQSQCASTSDTPQRGTTVMQSSPAAAMDAAEVGTDREEAEGGDTFVDCVPGHDISEQYTSLDKGCQTDDHLRKRIQQLEDRLKAEKHRNSQLVAQLSTAEGNAEHWKACFYELQSTSLCLDNMQTTEDMLYYTGLPSQVIFRHILDFVVKRNPHLAKGEDRGTQSVEEQMFMVLVRLRTGMQTKEVSRNFSVSMATFSRTFSRWILAMQKELVALTSFPSLVEVQQHIPPHFKRYPNTRIILDTTEIRIQKPSGHHAQRETFSNYKYANTMKCLVGATPDCYVSFVSALYGGGTSDRAIVQQSALLDL
ncbi:uncharacterized protein LOC135372273 [Ornithodoros turicata]|uniref:uncharacterized protein LOC135372273 n=1 Tax=Ornithodoros turicata TaxID=34597 RepID=UPI0031390BBC